jgi:hypothetical protein
MSALVFWETVWQMKNFLWFSILANLALCSLVLWLVRGKPVDRDIASAPVQMTNMATVVQVTQIPTESNQPVTQKPFRWSELESTDYRTYLANLRSTGCPEQTIRDILSADVDSVYAQRREQLERTSPGSLTTRQEVERLRGEEASFLAALLGDSTLPKEFSPKEPPWVVARRNVRAVVPLVFGNIDAANLQLNAGQMAVVEEVRQKFREEVGTQDANDPGYVQRWNKAQRDADDRLRGMLGSKVFLQYQLQAANPAPH